MSKLYVGASVERENRFLETLRSISGYWVRYTASSAHSHFSIAPPTTYNCYAWYSIQHILSDTSEISCIYLLCSFNDANLGRP